MYEAYGRTVPTLKPARRWMRRPVPEAARPRAKALLFGVLRPFLTGSAVTCPVCRRSFRRLIDVGSKDAPRFQCPGCGCYDRHRLLALHLERHDGLLLPPSGRVLHFAPEPNVSRLFDGRPDLRYVTGDLGARAADVQLDITKLPRSEERRVG